MESDPFDDLLNLEEKFYDEGFQQGIADGAKAGRIEGRVFGLEKGYEKYVQMGRLHGKSLVWVGRLPENYLPATNRDHPRTGEDEVVLHPDKEANPQVLLPLLPSNPRLEKHIRILYALVEPASLSTENSEDAVSDFDDRLKRAIGKAKIIEKLVREDTINPDPDSGVSGILGNQQNPESSGDNNIEDVNVAKARH